MFMEKMKMMQVLFVILFRPLLAAAYWTWINRKNGSRMFISQLINLQSFVLLKIG